jgi:hypothetical protein
MDDIDIDLKSTRSVLAILNRYLGKKCKGELSIQIIDNTNKGDLETFAIYDKDSRIDFVICMIFTRNRIKKCVSSISCKINDDMTLEFSSKTDEAFERKKYNLLLRSALILICPFIRVKRNQRITKILSRAVNPISIYSLVKYFHAYNEDLNNFMSDNNIIYDIITLKNVEEFYTSLDSDDMELDENMDEYELERFLKDNPDFGDPIVVMELDIQDINKENVKKQANKIFIETNNKISCPPEENTPRRMGGKKKTKRNKKTKRKKEKTKRKKETKGKS